MPRDVGKAPLKIDRQSCGESMHRDSAGIDPGLFGLRIAIRAGAVNFL